VTKLQHGRISASESCGKTRKTALHSYSYLLYIYASAACGSFGPRFRFGRNEELKDLRHSAIRDLVAHSRVTNQDELRRKLRRRGFQVTQATLSRDIHELRLYKGPGGYSLPNGTANGAGAAVEDDAPPSVEEMLNSFGLRVVHAMNQVIVRTAMGGAQPVAAALDRQAWPEVAGTIAGDDTVLVICQDQRRAGEVEARLRKILES
jgi:transcriptional regulator of arginine metabolism